MIYVGKYIKLEPIIRTYSSKLDLLVNILAQTVNNEEIQFNAIRVMALD